MKPIRKIIEVDEEKCDGCGQCVPACAESALAVVDGKAKVIKDALCDGLGACLGDCPRGALTIVERAAEPFDEEEVAKHLESMPAAEAPTAEAEIPTGCPGQAMRRLEPTATGKVAGPAPSALAHWPVKIRLVSKKAPFLENADLLVLADCAAIAHPSLHANLLSGKVVLAGCPKFDETEDYVKKFAEIFSENDIRSVTTAVMEVPCCSGLPQIVEKAVSLADRTPPPRRTIVIDAYGNVIQNVPN